MISVSAPTAVIDDDTVIASQKKLFETASYLNNDEQAYLRKACIFAAEAHALQYRKTGEPYINHPIAVATEIALWGGDLTTLIAALLHDVVEDTGVNINEIKRLFGDKVAGVVDGVSKLEKIAGKDLLELQAESFRKMLLAVVNDLRVLVVKLADRLHNMRTLGAMRQEKQRRIAKETLEVYAELANRIGMNPIYHELQDLSFKFLYSYRYDVISRALDNWRTQKGELIEKVMRDFSAQLVAFNVEATIKGNEKHRYGIFKKMRHQRLRFSQVMDMYGFVVMVNSLTDCYRALGALHNLYKPKPGTFKDYIAIPKHNGFQSLQTTLVSSQGLPIEVQIRTYEMDSLFEMGRFAASRKVSKKNATNLLRGAVKTWLENIKSVQSDSNNAVDFYENIKKDLYTIELYVFTPKGKIVVLPAGATVIDFAYAVDPELGHQSVSAKINGIQVSLQHRLNSGDIVDIQTRSDAVPDAVWLNFAVSVKATSAIRSRLRYLEREKMIHAGEKLLQNVLTEVLPEELISSEEVKDEYIRQLTARHLSFQDVLYEVGKGKILPYEVALEIAKIAYIPSQRVKVASSHKKNISRRKKSELIN